MKRLNVLYQCDNNFAFMAGVSFTSLVINAADDIRYFVYVLTPDMSEENRQKWYRVVSKYKKTNIILEFIDASVCAEEVASWNVPSHRGSWVTYYKLFVARIFPENSEVDKIIHIGADTLVTGSLKGLVDFDFEGQPFAMNWNENIKTPYYPKEAQYCIAEMGRKRNRNQ